MTYLKKKLVTNVSMVILSDLQMAVKTKLMEAKR